jgi:thioredoxin-related protein
VETTNRPQLAREFTEKVGATFPIVLDDQKLSRSVYGVTATPTNIIIDRQGRAIFRNLGYAPGKEKTLAAEVESLLGKTS